MRVNHDYVALDWVKEEIEQTLSHAKTALTAYSENPGDITRIRFCLTYLHQIYGTLQMVEFFGAALLAEEMEKLAQAMMSQKVRDLSVAQACLHKAMLQLPVYLERVKQGRKDVPIILLPLLNELRAARGEGLLTDSAFFFPDMESGNEAFFNRPSIVVNNTETLNFRQLRQLFQTSYAHLLRNQDVDNQLKKIATVIKFLESQAAKSAAAQFWWIADAFVEGLANKAILLNDTTRSLLAMMDRQLKVLIESEGAALHAPVSEEELKKLLFYIVQSSNDTPLISEVKKAYRLENAFAHEAQLELEASKLQGSIHDAQSEVMASLREAMNASKEKLNGLLYSPEHDIATQQDLIDQLKHIAESLVLVGLGSERTLVLNQVETLQHCFTQDHQSAIESKLLEVADALLYVESLLKDQTYVAGEHVGALSPRQLNEAQNALIRECRSGLERAKDLIVDFIVSQWNHVHLESVPELLTEVAGGLSMIQQNRASHLVTQCVQFIAEHLVKSKKMPSWKEMDTLADAISSIEYYLERLAEDSHTSDFVLDIAETSLKNLCEINDIDAPSSTPIAAPTARQEALSADALILDDDNINSLFDGTDQEAVLQTEFFSDEELNFMGDERELEEPMSMASSETALSGFDMTHSSQPSFKESEEQPLAAVEQKTEQPVTLAASTDENSKNDFIDDEIIEIFVEEVGEVIQALRTHLPEWKADPHAKAPLVEVRRAYHTLKGSGRLVGALAIGELAWAIESMLNRVIDGVIPASVAVIGLVEETTEVIPDFISAFQQHLAVPVIAEPLMARARALAEGKSSDLLLESEETNAIHITQAQAEPESFVEEVLEPLLSESAEEFASEFALENEVRMEAAAQESNLGSALDPALIDIFSVEASGHLATIQDFLSHNPVSSAPAKVSADVLRALHTLKGSAHMAGVNVMAELISPVEQLIKQVANVDYILQADLLDLLMRFSRVLGDQLQQLKEGTLSAASNTASLEAFVAQLEEKYHQQKAEHASKVSDQNFINIFLAEEMDVILEAASLLNAWEQSPYDYSVVSKLNGEVQSISRRANAAQIPEIESLCDGLSRCYQAVQNHNVHTDRQFFVITQEAHEKLIEFVDRLAAHQPIEKAREIEAQLQSLLDRAAFMPVTMQELENVEKLPVFDMDSETSRMNSSAHHSDESNKAWPLDGELVSLFLEEAQRLLQNLNQALRNWVNDPDQVQVLEPLLRDLHTLKGSARMAAIKPIADLSHEVERIYEACARRDLSYSMALEILLQEVNESLCSMVDTMREEGSCYENTVLLAKVKGFLSDDTTVLPASEAPAEDMSAQPVAKVMAEEPPVSVVIMPELTLDPELVGIFLEEADEILDSVSNNLENWAAEPENTAEIEALQRSLHTLKGSARMAGLKAIGDLSHELETLYELSVRGDLHYSGNMGQLLHRCHDTLADMVALVKQNKMPGEARELINQVLTFVNTGHYAHSPSAQAASSHTKKESATILPFKASEPLESSAKTAVQVEEEFVVDISDFEVINLFIEEARELLEGIEGSIEQWQVEPNSTAPRQELKRLLHTLKGSSRLAGLSSLGDMGHDFESYIINLDAQPGSDPALFDTLKAKYDALVGWVDKLIARVKVQEERSTVDQQTRDLIAKANEIARKANTAKEKASTQAEEQQESNKAATQEMVRVPADMLENLVNLAGETSISRARVEKEVADFKHTLADIGDTIERLQEQMRRLNIETEAQILFSHESSQQDKGAEYEDFDPLEMDRYSLIHQLSRSLAESSHDLTDLKDTLTNKTRDTERLLLQQARINTELQEGLMRTRLVPFSRLAPRLRRMVRQVSQELGKNVELQIVNAEGEMDRTVLDRMVSPLEHMLRNAIDHGIEMPQERERLGKNISGKITLHLAREGADVVLRLSDDGAGINAKKVRAKAIDLKMLDPEVAISDTEVLQFIFQPGFSTAEKVTQISGRGVGMDVVNNEIKLLGGSTRIHSAPGVGTQFTIRLPFTVSVNRALMVRVGEDTYAIPLSHIEGIVRVSPYELENFYQPGNQDLFKYADRDYTLQYLGAYVKNIPTPILQGQTQPLPVVLIRGTERPMAFQVDSLIGSREVVVKSLGLQLSSVIGLSGATILGDGNVVIILDLIAMIRSDWAQRLYGHARIEKVVEKASNAVPLVMVVDDSITVRKITSRLLERNGYEVILAKDGMDAISLLQDHTPDVMLLDIEMPRMDGFEVASIVKHEDRLKDIAIIMITSRTGQKHRERALSIGVNEYLGKPFQETELLQLIGKCVSAKVTV